VVVWRLKIPFRPVCDLACFSRNGTSVATQQEPRDPVRQFDDAFIVTGLDSGRANAPIHRL
jgi:hypothetical protein